MQEIPPYKVRDSFLAREFLKNARDSSLKMQEISLKNARDSSLKMQEIPSQKCKRFLPKNARDSFPKMQEIPP